MFALFLIPFYGYQIFLPDDPTFMATDAIFMKGVDVYYHYVVLHVFGFIKDPFAIPIASDDVTELAWFDIQQLVDSFASDVVPRTGEVVKKARKCYEAGLFTSKAK